MTHYISFSFSSAVFTRVAAPVGGCFLGVAPVCLQELRRPVLTLVGRRAHRSPSGSELLFNRVNTSTVQCLAFSAVVPFIGNSLLKESIASKE